MWLLLPLLTLPSVVQAQWNYTVVNGKITITGYTGPGGAVTIPDSINGQPVNCIGDRAFADCWSLTSITIPDSVTSLGQSAFKNSWRLASVTIGDGVTSLLTDTFYLCTGLTSVTLGNSVADIGYGAFEHCTGLRSVTIPNSVISIEGWAFSYCLGLTNVTIGNSVTNIGYNAFCFCTNLASVTIPDSVTSIGYEAFGNCTSLTSLNIGDGVISIGSAFEYCTSLISVTIGNSVSIIWDYAFLGCDSLTGVYFNGNAPSQTGSSVFAGDNNATVYYLPWTTGWAGTFAGRPTALASPPTIQTPPQTQTAETRSAVGLRVGASGSLPLFYVWYLNSTNLISHGRNSDLQLTNVQFPQSGAYTVIISNALGAVTSAPVLLNVIAIVERKPIPGVKVTGEPASLLNVDYADALSPAPTWTMLDSVSLTGTSQYCFDLTLPRPPQRFYRARQMGTPGVIPSLELHPVPVITLAGNISNSVRVDCINRFGPIDAWVTLATVTLTNTSQLYFDVSAPGQPERRYRLVQVP
jgi:hypothetical protein